MAGEISIDDATLYQAAKDCDAAVQEVNGEIRAVDNAKTTVHAKWKGNAATTFVNVMDRWQEDALKLTQAMTAIGELLDKTGRTHRQNEEEQDQMFNNFSAQLNL